MKYLNGILILILIFGSCKQEKKKAEKGIYINDFETMGRWKSEQTTNEAAHSGTYSTFTDELHEYSSTFRIPYGEVKGSKTVHVEAFVMSKEDGAAKLVVSVEKGEKKYVWDGLDIASLIQDRKGWNKIETHIRIPADTPDDADVFIYGWDTGKKKILWDDFNIKFQ